MLYADKHIKSHEIHVNLKLEMAKVWDWLNTNKLTLNAKKSNFVIFRPYQRKWTVWLIFRFLITTPTPYLIKPHPGNFYINISKTNKKLTRSFTRFEAKLWNSIPAEIQQYPKKPSEIMFMNLCYLFYKLRLFTLKHLLHSNRIRKNLVGAEQDFSLYLGHRLYFNLNQISTHFVASSL